MTAELDALQRILAGEHAAIYGYGVVGARLAGRGLAAAASGFEGHRRRRDVLELLIRARGAEPVASAPAYVLPFAVHRPADAFRLAVLIEERLAAMYVAVLGVTDDATVRRTAALVLQEVAARATTWRVAARIRPATRPFPGR